MLTSLDDGERRAHPPRGIVAEQIAAAEGIAPEYLVVVRVEWGGPARGELAARHAPHDDRDRFDRLIHFGGHVAQYGITVAAQPGGDAPRRALLAPRPDEPGRRDDDRVAGCFGGHRAGVQPVRILSREHQKPESHSREFDRRFGKVEAEFLERAPAWWDEHLARRCQRDNCRAGGTRDGGRDQGSRANGAHSHQPIST